MVSNPKVQYKGVEDIGSSSEYSEEEVESTKDIQEKPTLKDVTYTASKQSEYRTTPDNSDTEPNLDMKTSSCSQTGHNLRPQNRKDYFMAALQRAKFCWGRTKKVRANYCHSTQVSVWSQSTRFSIA